MRRSGRKGAGSGEEADAAYTGEREESGGEREGDEVRKKEERR